MAIFFIYIFIASTLVITSIIITVKEKIIIQNVASLFKEVLFSSRIALFYTILGAIITFTILIKSFLNLKDKQIELFQGITLALILIFIVLSIIFCGVIVLRYIKEDFLKDKKLNGTMQFLLITPISFTFATYSIFEHFKKVEYTENKLVQNFSLFFMLLCIVQMILSFILIYHGLKKCMFNKTSIKPKNDNASILETKISVIVFWFFIIWLNSASMVYITYKFDPNAFTKVNGFFDSAYFSLITILTIGYGDLAPNNSWAKFVVCLIVITYAYFIVVGVAGILSSEDEVTKGALRINKRKQRFKVSKKRENKRYSRVRARK